MRTVLNTLMIAGLAFVLWNIFAPPQLTIFPALGDKLGALEANWIAGRTPAAEDQAQALAEAEAKVQRLTVLNQKAVELEAQIAQKQITSTANSHWVKNFGANVSDVLCGIHILDQRTGGQPTGDLEKLCSAGDTLRRSMAQDYSEALNNGRTTVMRDMNRAFRDAQQNGGGN